MGAFAIDGDVRIGDNHPGTGPWTPRQAGSYDDWTVARLRKRAAEIGIEGRSSMPKSELVRALRHHRAQRTGLLGVRRGVRLSDPARAAGSRSIR